MKIKKLLCAVLAAVAVLPTVSAFAMSTAEFDNGMRNGINYFNRGLYYEARDEFQWFCDYNWGNMNSGQQQYALDYLGAAKQKTALWEKIEKKKKALTDFLNDGIYSYYDKIKADPYSDYASDSEFEYSTHLPVNYAFFNMDNDPLGSEELVTYTRINFDSEYPQYCFSVWNYNRMGQVFSVMSKREQNTRMMYQYGVVGMNGKNYICECTGETNSSHVLKIRNLYEYSDGALTKVKSVYYADYVDAYQIADDPEMYLIDGQNVSKSACENLINQIDNNIMFF